MSSVVSDSAKEICVTTSIHDTKKIIRDWDKAGLRIGFVPTMGFLHAGHKSLIERSVSENDRTVVSIFVNPAQFAPNEDFDAYPRDFDSDKSLCEFAGADLIFHPASAEMYPEKPLTCVSVPELSAGLCGKSRPAHFSGVCLVVAKLLNITGAERAYFGEKDAQQLAIIRRLVRDLNIDTEIIPCPIIREDSGLAVSSRNKYLTEKEKESAAVLNKSLLLARDLFRGGERSSAVLKAKMRELIEREPVARTDYIEIVDETFTEKDVAAPGMLAALAVYFGNTRLIDNMRL
ncbi:pantothenate synthetase [Clostridia bacterium]|nr:pantothenate synthetase [Clostridia bacterium]